MTFIDKFNFLEQCRINLKMAFINLLSILLGGMSLTDDMVKAKRCHIAVGTPGRIRALINAKNIDAKSTRLFVLDEADKLMESAFRSDLREIQAQCFHMEVKVAVLNAISQSCSKKSDFFEVKLVPYASLCLENYLDQFLMKF